ncbi:MULTISPECIES: TetR/AcrR family transcriptional regulator [Phenylobacterium]|uniref:AcrR family transcriptional regulator n=1 Tax=Phenylobacterium koreense TaxID=266125 RepID=A0ABV2EN18_9CAUL
MPRVLSESDVADFRERLCDVAERLFAEKGPEAVTMRQLAAELGVSPMTPYRYFADKEDILAAVRTNGFNRFAQALERAYAEASGAARARGAAVGEAYLDFAFEHPQAYKAMFDLNQPHEENYPDLVAAGARARSTMTEYVKALVAEGVLAGDPEEIGRMFWAAAHGAVVLELSGKIPAGSARTLHRHMNGALAKGLRPGA